ncbi:MAG: type II toxin-antitoxin system PemK/MazF family toxin [Deltaproteobacteria bacterium]|nr:type II toxin-antitoxin system PemK/MazF family toxin [Deltaproteobacteria bacterium]
MTSYDSGDVVLVRFPFTDLETTKKRPALVVSPREFSDFHGDLVVMALTSQDQRDDKLRIVSWKASGLLKPTWIKPLVATIASVIVDRRLGQIDDADHGSVRAALDFLIAEPFTRR